MNDSLDSELKESLIENGYWVFPDRQVHLFYLGKQVMQRSHTKRDMALLRNSPYTVVTHDDLTIEDAKRIAELYRMLFFDKHSTLNPLYTADYFKNAIRSIGMTMLHSVIQMAGSMDLLVGLKVKTLWCVVRWDMTSMWIKKWNVSSIGCSMFEACQ